MVKEIGPVSFFFFRILTSAKPRPVRNDIWQYHGLDLDKINAYAKCYQKYSTRFKTRPVSLFYNSDLGKASTNGKWYLAIPCARFCQYHCAAKFHQNIPYGSRDSASFTFCFQDLDIGKASTDDKCHLAIPSARVCQYQ